MANESTRRDFLQPSVGKKDENAAFAAAPPPASGQLRSADDQNRMKLADSQVTTIGAGVAAAKAPAAPAMAVNHLAEQAQSALFATAGSQNFADGRQNMFRNMTATITTPPVLANFQVQQNGNAIRVVDADGSVYDGALQAQGTTAQNISVQTAMPASTGNGPAQNDQPKSITTRDELITAKNYYFRVSGINRTLKQKVDFAGNLLAMTDLTTNLQQSFKTNAGADVGASSGGSQAMATAQLPWSNSRIAGTAIIADTTNIEINALPQSQ
jgi:hypothetical protein